ncbi:hypothetical protein [Nocardioides flavescens]|uniref:hypothetical protein n=1 Tax=Nocardioides flavescens TaxID=2691959 RepID=UPI001928D25F|nr:hypothetical protein [Nocardioides flavescens]
MVRRAAGAAALLSLALLAGCGSGETPQAPETTPTARDTNDGAAGPSAAAPSPSPLPSPSPTASAPAPAPGPASDDALAALAEAAQSQAGEVATARAGEQVLGADVSWPQCPAGMGIEHKVSHGAPMPTAEAEYVVVGLTNGPGFTPNPCLADQVAWVRERGLLLSAYSVVSWPDAAAQAEHGGLAEAGRAQAAFNVASMRAVGLQTPIVWLDVEHVPHYEWSQDPRANAEVVLGAAQGYLDAGYAIGVYSTPYIWGQLVGDLSLQESTGRDVPEWRAAGQTSMAEALSRCGADWSIQGGTAVLGQWVQDGRDKNVTCPGAELRLGELFATTR